jgi:hypothetical protein
MGRYAPRAEGNEGLGKCLTIQLSRASPRRAIFTRGRQTGFDSSMRKGRFMTREELLTKQEYMWQALSGKHSMTLTLAVEMLLRCHLPPLSDPDQTMTALEGS